MQPVSPIRKIFQGVADRRQMFRMFDRHAQRPNRWQDDAGARHARVAIKTVRIRNQRPQLFRR